MVSGSAIYFQNSYTFVKEKLNLEMVEEVANVPQTTSSVLASLGSIWYSIIYCGGGYNNM